MPTAPDQLPRVLRLRDVVLFNIPAIGGLGWLTTAASQFGLASLLLWVVAMLVFFLPSAVAVRELADIDPGAGGIYRWVRRAFGLRHGFVAGWGYWVNNLFYFPSLLVATAAIAAYAGGPRFVHLGDDGRFIAVLSLVGLWLAVGMNVVGLRVGKRLQNLGGYGTWLPALIFVALATWSLVTRGSATPFSARGLLPSTFDLASINLFATMTFALGNLGGVGAWLAGSARLPFVAGLDGALPAAFGRIHPRWQTPYVGLLVQGALATLFVVASLIGSTVKNAYLVLTQTTLILFFIPYLYLFAAYLRLRRTRTAVTALIGVVGLAAVAFSIVLGFVPPGDEVHPWGYEAKVVGGVIGFMGIGLLLARRGVRGHTASTSLPR